MKTHPRVTRHADLLVDCDFRFLISDRGIDWIVNYYSMARADLFVRPPKPLGDKPFRTSTVRQVLTEARPAQDIPREVVRRAETTVLQVGYNHTGIATEQWDGWRAIAYPLVPPGRFRWVTWWQERRGRSLLVGVTACKILGARDFTAAPERPATAGGA